MIGSVGGELVGKLLESVAQAIADIWGNLSTDFLKDFVQQVKGERNHDLQRALAVALELALQRKRNELREQKGEKHPLRGKRLPDEHEQLFDIWLKKLQQAQSDEQALNELFAGAMSPEATVQLASGEGDKQAWWEAAEKALQRWAGEKPIPNDLRNFLQENLLPNFHAAFAEVLKNPDHQQAWIAFQRSLLTEMMACLSSLQAQVTQLTEEQRRGFNELRQRLERLMALPGLLAQLAQSVTQVLSVAHEIAERVEAVIQQTAILTKMMCTLEDMRALVSGAFIREGVVIEFPRRRRDDALLKELTESAPFVGREQAMQRLTEFVHSGGYFLVTAPAGGGKSTLMAHFLRSLSQNSVQVCYHFFNTQWGTDDFYGGLACLAEQLLRTHRIEGAVRESEPTQLCTIVTEMLSLPHPFGLVVVVDGLDEVRDRHAGEFTFPKGLFPEPLGEGVTVLFTARAFEGAGTAAQIGKQLGLTSVTHYHLPDLDTAAVRELLQQAPNKRLKEKASDESFIRRLWEKTGGLAIYLRHLIEQLTHATESEWEGILDALPREFEDFVAQIAKAAQVKPEWDEALCVLAFAKGWLPDEDLMELAGLRRRDFNRLPFEVARWLTVRRKNHSRFYTYSHSAIAEGYRRHAFSQKEAQDYRQKLLDYCADWQRHKSPYALRHYPEHLAEAKRYDELFELARNEEFAKAQGEKFPEEEPTLPLQTKALALKAAIKRDDGVLMAEFVLSHAHTVAQIQQQENPLQALRETGNLKRALNLANLYTPEAQILWHLLLAWELKDRGQVEEAKEVLQKLRERLEEQKGLRFEGWRKDAAVLFLSHLADVAGETALAIAEQGLDAEGLRKLAETLAEAGKFEQAKKMEFILSHAPMVAQKERAEVLQKIAKALTEKGDFKQALQVAWRIKEGRERVRSLRKIIKALSKAGEIAQELQVARMVRAREQAQELRRKAEDLAKKEEFEQALQVAERIEDAEERAGALQEIAEALAKAGERKRAREVFEQAIKVAERIEDARERAGALLAIAEGLARAGEFEQAMKVAERIEDAWERAWALRAIAEALAKAGEIEQAMKVTEGIGDAFWRALALQAIAKALAGAGEKERAKQIFNQALQVAEGIEGVYWRSESLRAIAEALAEAGEKERAKQIFNQALQVAEGIEGGEERARMLREIAEALAKVEEFEQAVQVAKRIEDSFWRPWAMREITKALAEKKKFEEAKQLAQDIRDDFWRAWAERKIAEALAMAGEFDQAVQRAKSIEDEEEQARALREIDEVLAKGKEFGQALQMAKEITDPMEQAEANRKIAEALAEIGEFEQATQVAGEISDVRERAMALRETALMLAKATKSEEAKEVFDQALKVADGIKDGDERAWALRAIAEALAKAGQGERAVEVAERIQIERNKHLPAIAAALVEAGDKENFKRLLLPCAYHLDAAYEMCRLLARVYPQQAMAIAEVVRTA